VVGLPVAVHVRQRQGVVLELGGDLHPFGAEQEGDRRVHVGAVHVGGVELIDHARLARDRGVGLERGGADAAELRAFQLAPRDQSRGIGDAGDAIGARGAGGGVASLPGVVIDRLGGAAGAQGVRQRVDVVGHQTVRRVRRIERFVDAFEGQHAGVVGIAASGNAVDMLRELLEEAGLGRPGGAVGGQSAHRIDVREALRAFGPDAAAPPGDRRKHGVEPLLAADIDQLIQQR